MEAMPSCTTPIFSKIEETLKATQPEMFTICQAMGSAVATTPSPISPRVQSQIDSAAIPVISSAFSEDSNSPFSVTMRVWRWKRSVSWFSPSPTKSSSSRARAKSFTVRMLV